MGGTSPPRPKGGPLSYPAARRPAGASSTAEPVPAGGARGPGPSMAKWPGSTVRPRPGGAGHRLTTSSTQWKEAAHLAAPWRAAARAAGRGRRSSIPTAPKTGARRGGRCMGADGGVPRVRHRQRSSRLREPDRGRARAGPRTPVFRSRTSRSSTPHWDPVAADGLRRSLGIGEGPSALSAKERTRASDCGDGRPRCRGMGRLQGGEPPRSRP